MENLSGTITQPGKLYLDEDPTPCYKGSYLIPTTVSRALLHRVPFHKETTVPHIKHTVTTFIYSLDSFQCLRTSVPTTTDNSIMDICSPWHKKAPTSFRRGSRPGLPSLRSCMMPPRKQPDSPRAPGKRNITTRSITFHRGQNTL